MVPYFVEEHQIRSTMIHALLDMMIMKTIKNQNCLYVQLKHCETLLSISSSSSSMTRKNISLKLARSVAFIKKLMFSVTSQLFHTPPTWPLRLKFEANLPLNGTTLSPLLSINQHLVVECSCCCQKNSSMTFIVFATELWYLVLFKSRRFE